ncbi:MAG: hypothetical protein ACFFEK_08885 [Candidatus Thorarchaeota archaeon]
MNHDEDTFYEDDEYEEEEEEEEEEEDIFPDDEEDYDVADALYESGESRLESFARDPWPKTTFLLLVIGFAMIFFTPTNVWFAWNYFLIANYLMLIVGGAAICYSLITWTKAGKHRLRWAGLTNLILIFALIIAATLDSFSWILNLHSIFPGVETPIISLALVLAVFSIYSLWVIQRNFAGPNR